MAIAISMSLLVALAKYVIRGKKALNTTRIDMMKQKKAPKPTKPSKKPKKGY